MPVAENRVSFLLNDLVREMNGQADAMLKAKFDLTYSQFVFLLALSETGQVDVTRLAMALGVTKGAVSKRLSWFTERNLAITSQLPGDAKRVVISLTDAGSGLAKAAGDFLEERFLTTLSSAPDLNQGALREELQKMLELLRAKRNQAL